MKLTFIGFGEAAYNIAAGLKSEGFTDIGAYDINSSDDKLGKNIHKRAESINVQLFSTLEEACKTGDFIVSLTSAKVALKVAESIFPFITDKQVFVDMNSAAPTVKADIAKAAVRYGTFFCDAAVMGTVPGKRHKVPMFLAGTGAQKFYDVFSKYGMKLTVLNAEAGGASAIKMFKSVIMKGLPQLMFESFEAARKYGVLDKLMVSLASSLEGKTVEQLANTFIARTMIHAERRSAEMKDVVATLESLGIDASMSKATVAKLETLAQTNWADKLGENGSELKYQEALNYLK